jgi:uncharacterized protein (DUF2344 family)
VEAVAVGTPAATQLLERAEYTLSLSTIPSESATFPSREMWQMWIDNVLAAKEIWFEQTTKSGKVQQVNLRDRLFSLQLISTNSPNFPLPTPHSLLPTCQFLNYTGSCRNDGTLLRPDHIVNMLEQVSGEGVQLLHVHRENLWLANQIV